jgi:SAM-dependent methyltransferase
MRESTYVDSASSYWDGIGHHWSDQQLSPWRQFTDRQQLALIQEWLPLPVATPFSLLKTDLFDEVAHRGVVEGLLRHGLAVIGIDVSPVIVDEAVARNPGLHGLMADVRQLPFASEHFDAVFSGSTLDHLQSSTDIAAALAELGRVLKPGGRFILTMDNPENPLIRLRNGPLLGLLLRLGIVPYQVGVTIARAPLLKALRKAGFRVVTTRAFMHCPRVLAVSLAQPIRHCPSWCQRTFLRHLESWELLARLPSRWLTAHYIAVLAQKPEVLPHPEKTA